MLFKQLSMHIFHFYYFNCVKLYKYIFYSIHGEIMDNLKQLIDSTLMNEAKTNSTSLTKKYLTKVERAIKCCDIWKM